MKNELETIKSNEIESTYEYSLVETHAENEYDAWCASTREIPELEAIIAAVSTEIYTEYKIQLIDEAIHRNDHQEIYGMNAADFMVAAFEGELIHEELEPLINSELLGYCTFYYLTKHRMCFIDLAGNPRNHPVKGVW